MQAKEETISEEQPEEKVKLSLQVNEVTCIECGLPSHRGLPPFIAVRRFVDGDFKTVLRHKICPDNPEMLLQYILTERQSKKEMLEIKRRMTFTRRWTAPSRLL